MTRHVDRRSLLLATGTTTAGAVAGCLDAIPGVGGGGGGSDAPTEAEEWPMPRGTAEQTGASASGGPGPDASIEFEAELRDGIRPGDWVVPTVGEDGIYAMGTERAPYSVQPPRFRLYAYRLSRSDGSEDWRRILVEHQETGGVPLTKDYGGPLVTSEAVFVTWIQSDQYQFHVAALSPEDGSTMWRKQLAEGPPRTSSPVVHDDTLYLFDGLGSVRALSTADGSEQWRSPALREEQRIPVVGERGIAVYHVGTDDGPERGLSVLNPEDGSVRWSIGREESRLPTPTVVGDTVFLTDGGSRGIYGISSDRPPRTVRALSMEDGSETWSHTYETEAIAAATAPGGTATVTAAGDHVYYGLGFPTAAEFLGQAPSPEELERIRNQLYEGPNVVALDRSDGSVVWKTQIGTLARVFRPMVAGPDRLYAQYRGTEQESGNRIYVLDRESGEVLGDFGPIAESNLVAIADGTLYTHEGGVIRAWE